jgi:SAM-dependent methyltransferase
MLCGRPGFVLHDQVRDYLFGAPGDWNLRRCPPCDLAWLDPAPAAEDLGALYRSYHTHETPGSGAGATWWSKLTPLFHAMRELVFGYPVRSSRLAKAAAAVLASVTPLRDLGGATVLWLPYPRLGGRLLDVGCGSGKFLEDMSALGWRAEGIDNDPLAVAAAASRPSIRVRCHPLVRGIFDPGSFDAVTLNHVIEHVPDPVESLKICRDYLKVGGRLVAVTPNLNALSRRFFGKFWRGWETPRHLNLFSADALRECATRAGLVPKAVWTTARGAAWFWISSMAIRDRRDAVRAGDAGGPLVGRVAGLLFAALEHALNPALRCGEELVLVATRGPES